MENIEQIQTRRILFSEFARVREEDKEKFVVACQEIETLLTGTVAVFKRNCVTAGRLLTQLEKSGVYKWTCSTDSKYESYQGLYIKDPFYKFCERYFGLSKSTVYSLMHIYQEFGCDDGELKPPYKKYKYSQLQEMCSMSPTLLFQVRPEMTVKEMRSMKKAAKVAEKVDAPKKEKTAKTVNRYAFSDLKEKRVQFQTLCKQHFENYGYKLTLNGRAQGGQAFAGGFFDFLEKRGFFDNEDLSKQSPGLLRDIQE